MRALVKEEIDRNRVEVVEETNKACSTDIKLFINPVTTKKGMREDDPLLTKLFTVCFEMMFRKIKREGGISAKSERFNLSRFACDVLIANSARELLQDLNARNQEAALKLMTKRK